MAYLQIYIARGCPMCTHSRLLAAEITARYPFVRVELIDIATVKEEALPEVVFATPTWLWDGHLFSLGNPDPAQLWQRLDESTPSFALPPIKDDSHGREDAPPLDDGTVSGSF